MFIYYLPPAVLKPENVSQEISIITITSLIFAALGSAQLIYFLKTVYTKFSQVKFVRDAFRNAAQQSRNVLKSAHYFSLKKSHSFQPICSNYEAMYYKVSLLLIKIMRRVLLKYL